MSVPQILKKVDVGMVHPMLFPEVQSGKCPVCSTARIIAKDSYFTCIEVSWVTDRKAGYEKKGHEEKASLLSVFSERVS